MKKIMLILLSLCISNSYAVQCVPGQTICQITLVNKFDKPLVFKKTINNHVAKDLPDTFVLKRGDSITTVIEPSVPEKTDYIGGKTVLGEQFGNVFFAVGPNQIHGYVGSKVAYSWMDKTNTTIVFCTPEVYEKHDSCPITTEG